MRKNTIANPDPAKVISRASECLRRLMEIGLSYEDLQTPIDDPEMRQRLVRYWQSNCVAATDIRSIQLSRLIQLGYAKAAGL
ncbi:MAG: hypothetical protein AAB465_02540, partial [Patescibacteria group bacterium]